MGEYAKAEPLYQEALRIRQKVLGPENPDTAISLNNLAVLYQNGRVRQSRTALPGSPPDPPEGSWAQEHPDTAMSLNYLVRAVLDNGRVHESLNRLYQEAVTNRQKVLGPAKSL